MVVIDPSVTHPWWIRISTLVTPVTYIWATMQWCIFIFVWNDYQSYYKALLQISGRELMYISRLKKLACFVYTCLNNTGPGLTNDLFNKKEIKYNLRDSSRVEQPLCSMTRYGLNSIAYQGASLWNSLPHDLKDCIDFKYFQSMIQSWNSPVCHCGFCVLCKF